jgi:hypothetical protein
MLMRFLEFVDQCKINEDEVMVNGQKKNITFDVPIRLGDEEGQKKYGVWVRKTKTSEPRFLRFGEKDVPDDEQPVKQPKDSNNTDSASWWAYKKFNTSNPNS